MVTDMYFCQHVSKPTGGRCPKPECSISDGQATASPVSRDRFNLRKVLSRNKDLYHAFMNDATVHAWFRMAELSSCTLEEAYIGIIVELAREKKKYFDEVVKLTSLVGPAPEPLIDPNLRSK